MTSALGHISDRVHELVYLDAFVPRDGETVAGLWDASAERRSPSATSGWFRHPNETTTTPRKPSGSPLAECRTRFDASPSPSIWRSRSRTTRSGSPTSRRLPTAREAPGGAAFWDAADHARASDRWGYHEIGTNHMVASNRPGEASDVACSDQRRVPRRPARVPATKSAAVPERRCGNTLRASPIRIRRESFRWQAPHLRRSAPHRPRRDRSTCQG